MVASVDVQAVAGPSTKEPIEPAEAEESAGDDDMIEYDYAAESQLLITHEVKLWDFGGMDVRCKPFKTWEPAGTYYVGYLFPPFRQDWLTNACSVNA